MSLLPEICTNHGLPLTQLCKDTNTFICEACAVEDFKSHDVLHLRPLIVDIMTKLEQNFETFQQMFEVIKNSRVSEYREKVYKDVDEFFDKIHQFTDHMHK
jgi:hypothetical protein